ncbi:MAG: type II toxin-antitoxin system PemK/MazF family toxin [Candidatus Melainabacteria bacterium]|nr:type II toxin-antitoxin system PemK/MazF family toxin [Candidatus Melainabacteria bacterium]
MAGNSASPKRGEIWFANLGELDPSKGAEIQKSRPVLIIGNNIVNQRRRTVLVIPLATSGGQAQANPPITVEIVSGRRRGIAVIDQLRALDKQRLVNLIDTIHEGDLELVVQALCQVLEIS